MGSIATISGAARFRDKPADNCLLAIMPRRVGSRPGRPIVPQRRRLKRQSYVGMKPVPVLRLEVLAVLSPASRAVFVRLDWSNLEPSERTTAYVRQSIDAHIRSLSLVARIRLYDNTKSVTSRRAKFVGNWALGPNERVLYPSP